MKVITYYIVAIVLLYSSIGQAVVDLNVSKSSVYSFHKQRLDDVIQRIQNVNIQHVSFPVQSSADSSKRIYRRGILSTQKDAIGTVVVCHGYTSSKNESQFFRSFFPHFNVLAFDFRAHGEDTQGQVATIGRDEAFDVIGAVNFLKKQKSLGDQPVIGFGFSMGAVSLIEAQSKDSSLFNMLILDGPYDSTDDSMNRNMDSIFKRKIFGREVELPGKKFVMKILYSERMRPLVRLFFKWSSGLDSKKVETKFVQVRPIDSVKKITVPCFFISCEKDKKIPPFAVKRLYDSVQSPFKRMWITQGPWHCGSHLEQPELYWYKLNKFIRNVLDGVENKKEKEKLRDDRVIITGI